MALPCLVCGKELEQIDSGSFNHPNNACACYTHGNYGSCVFDPLNDYHLLEFNVCDECLVKYKDSIRLVIRQHHTTEEVHDFDPGTA